ncbi:hypothetical protein THMIRHAS_24080 [Thiosulfatimonas sediminis]|uniref:Lipoprotein n=1 Tax=Thiosulfatimonas sediminis TaxID=2675054 RepID=A0A6F8PY25_9GAMM|nr:hypothetical protein [Thiosulfatimonas sediminis]BBP47035.1 hypothetical protein THMIRHAS_24080 [Thiosulfatimonas sediminis]
MTKILSTLSLLFTVVLLAGCFGLTQPTDSDIQAMAKEKFNQEFLGLFLADTVVKDNGYKKNDTHYVAELTITATAQRSLDEYAREIMRDSTLSHMEKMKQTFGIGVLKMTLPEFKQGDSIDFSRNYLFIKTDNGWMIKGTLEDSKTDSI